MRRPTHQHHAATPIVNNTDSPVGLMGWLDTQSNAGLRIIGSRGHSHVILISSWPRTHVQSREHPGFAVSPLGVKLAPETSDRAVPFRQMNYR